MSQPSPTEDFQSAVFELFYVATVCRNVLTDAERMVVRELRQTPFSSEQMSSLVHSCAISMYNGPNHVPCLNKMNLFVRKEDLESYKQVSTGNHIHDRLVNSSNGYGFNKSNWKMNERFIIDPEWREQVFKEIKACDGCTEFQAVEKQYKKIVDNDWTESGSFSKIFPELVQNLKEQERLDKVADRGLLNMLKKKIGSLSVKEQIDQLTDTFYPKERDNLVDCIRTEVNSKPGSFNYPDFLENCKLSINQFYFKVSTHHCRNNFMNCIKRSTSDKSLERVSLIQSMDCSSSAVTPEETQCKNEFLTYFNGFVQEHVKPETQGLVEPSLIR